MGGYGAQTKAIGEVCVQLWRTGKVWDHHGKTDLRGAKHNRSWANSSPFPGLYLEE